MAKIDDVKSALFNIGESGISLEEISPFSSMHVDNLLEQKSSSLLSGAREIASLLNIESEDGLFLLTVQNSAKNFEQSRLYDIGSRFEQTLYYTKYNDTDTMLFYPIGQINFLSVRIPKTINKLIDTLAVGYDEIICDYRELFYGLNNELLKKTNSLLFLEDIFVKEEFRGKNIGTFLLNTMLKKDISHSLKKTLPSILLYMDKNRKLEHLARFYTKCFQNDFDISFFGEKLACAQFTPHYQFKE